MAKDKPMKKSLSDTLATVDAAESAGEPINVSAIAHDAGIAAGAADTADEVRTFGAIAEGATKLEKTAGQLLDEAQEMVDALDTPPTVEALNAAADALQLARTALVAADLPTWARSKAGEKLAAIQNKLTIASYEIEPPPADKPAISLQTSMEMLIEAMSVIPDDISAEAALSELSEVSDKLSTMTSLAQSPDDFRALGTARGKVDELIAKFVERKKVDEAISQRSEPSVNTEAAVPEADVKAPAVNHIAGTDFEPPRDIPTFIKEAPAEQRNAMLVGYFVALNDMLRHGATSTSVFNAVTDRRIAVRHFKQAGIVKDVDLQAIVNCVLNG